MSEGNGLLVIDEKQRAQRYAEYLLRALPLAESVAEAVEAVELAIFDEDSLDELDSQFAIGTATGSKWKGPSGRWFIRRDDGRVVPTAAPGPEEKTEERKPAQEEPPAQPQKAEEPPAPKEKPPEKPDQSASPITVLMDSIGRRMCQRNGNRIACPRGGDTPLPAPTERPTVEAVGLAIKQATTAPGGLTVAAVEAIATQLGQLTVKDLQQVRKGIGAVWRTRKAAIIDAIKAKVGAPTKATEPVPASPAQAEPAKAPETAPAATEKPAVAEPAKTEPPAPTPTSATSAPKTAEARTPEKLPVHERTREEHRKVRRWNTLPGSMRGEIDAEHKRAVLENVAKNPKGLEDYPDLRPQKVEDPFEEPEKPVTEEKEDALSPAQAKLLDAIYDSPKKKLGREKAALAARILHGDDSAIPELESHLEARGNTGEGVKQYVDHLKSIAGKPAGAKYLADIEKKWGAETVKPPEKKQEAKAEPVAKKEEAPPEQPPAKAPEPAKAEEKPAEKKEPKAKPDDAAKAAAKKEKARKKKLSPHERWTEEKSWTAERIEGLLSSVAEDTPDKDVLDRAANELNTGVPMNDVLDHLREWIYGTEEQKAESHERRQAEADKNRAGLQAAFDAIKETTERLKAEKEAKEPPKKESAKTPEPAAKKNIVSADPKAVYSALDDATLMKSRLAGQGLHDVGSVWGNLKRTIPGVTKEDYQSLMKHLASQRIIELHSINERHLLNSEEKEDAISVKGRDYHTFMVRPEKRALVRGAIESFLKGADSSKEESKPTPTTLASFLRGKSAVKLKDVRKHLSEQGITDRKEQDDLITEARRQGLVSPTRYEKASNHDPDEREHFYEQGKEIFTHLSEKEKPKAVPKPAEKTAVGDDDVFGLMHSVEGKLAAGGGTILTRDLTRAAKKAGMDREQMEKTILDMMERGILVGHTDDDPSKASEEEQREMFSLPEEVVGGSRGYQGRVYFTSVGIPYRPEAEEALRKFSSSGKDKPVQKPIENAAPKAEAPRSEPEEEGPSTWERTPFGEVRYPKGFTARSTKNVPNAMLPDESRPSLTPEEKEAVNKYTADHFDVLNEALREGSTIPPAHSKTHQRLEAAFAKVKPFKEPKDAYRGMKVKEDKLKGFLDNLRGAEKSGKSLKVNGYVSASTAGQNPGFKGNVAIKISGIRKGLDVKPYSHRASEDEILLNHGTSFKVKSVSQKGEKWLVHLEYADEA